MASSDCHLSQDTPDQIRVSGNMAAEMCLSATHCYSALKKKHGVPVAILFITARRSHIYKTRAERIKQSLYTAIIFFFTKALKTTLSINLRENPHGVEANALDCSVEVSEFDLQSQNYVHFRINTLGKGINFLIPTPSYGLILLQR